MNVKERKISYERVSISIPAVVDAAGAERERARLNTSIHILLVQVHRLDSFSLANVVLM